MTAIESPRDGLEPLLSVKELAAYLGISESGVYRLLKAGDLAAVKVGGRTLFERQDVRDFIEARRHRVPGGRALSATEESEEA
jgi:excisionase family DNA binding protein